MKRFLRSILVALFCLQIAAFVASAAQSEENWEQYAVYHPEPVIPEVAVRLGWHGKMIADLTINPKSGVVDEVKVIKHTASGKLDAIFIMNYFSWKFRPGTITHARVAYEMKVLGETRSLH